MMVEPGFGCRWVGPICLFLLGWGFSFTAYAVTVEYQTPNQPIAPKQKDECNALYAQYERIRKQLSQKARELGDQASARVSRGEIPYQGTEAKRLFDEAQRLHREASKLLSQASRARLQCMNQVRAYQKAQRKKEQAQRQKERRHRAQLKQQRATQPRLAGEPQIVTTLPSGSDSGRQSGAGSHGQDLIRRTTAQQARQQAERMAKQSLQSLLPQSMQNMLNLADKANSVSNTSGAARMLLSSSGYFSRLDVTTRLADAAIGSSKLPPISRVLTGLAISLVTDLHGTAMRDLQQGLTRFDQDPLSVARQSYTSEWRRTRELASPGGDNASSINSVSQNLRQALDAATEVVMAKRSDNAAAYRRYSEQQRAARARQQGKEKKRRSTTQSSERLSMDPPSGGDGRGKTVAECIREQMATAEEIASQHYSYAYDTYMNEARVQARNVCREIYGQ